MKYCVIVFIIMVIYPTYSREQSLQGMVSIDSQVGYSTNSYLNPWVGFWNTNLEGTYGLLAPDIQLDWYRNGNSIIGSAGGFFQPYIGGGKPTYGGVAMIQYQHNFSYHWQTGITGGGQTVTNQFGRKLGWLQAHLSWFITSNSRLTINAGTSNRSYSGLNDTTASSGNRFDSYGFQFEIWPWYHWRMNVSFFGDLDHIGYPTKNVTSHVSITHVWNNGANIALNGGVGQFENDLTVYSGGSVYMGIPNVAQTESVKNRLYNVGLQGEIPLSNKWALTANAAFSAWSSTITANARKDVQTSIGVRWYFDPGIGHDKRNIKPQWYQKGNDLFFEVHYTGGGRLFLVGDFDNWSKPGKPLLKQTDNTYQAVLRLKPGVYEYKILKISGTDTQWLKLGQDVSTISDGFGGVNGRFIVDMNTK